MEKKISKLESAQSVYKDFANEFKTLQMATIDSHGIPNASYSPYVKVSGLYYVYVSELSEHTKNLISNPLASIFFVQNEEDAKHLFVRRRLTYSCNVTEVQRKNDLFDRIMESFAESFGEKFINMIRGLEDFHLFQFEPSSGIFVNGFGQAFDTTGKNMIELTHKNDVGHRATNKDTEDQMTASAE